MNKQIINKVRAPKGFAFKIIEHGVVCDDRCTSYCYGNDDMVFVFLYDKQSATPNNYIGSIELQDNTNNYGKSRKRSFETHSHLDSKYHGKGLGYKLYARAVQWCLENGYKVSSSTGPSDAAMRVWTGKSIKKYFNIKKRMDSDGCYAWHAYAKKG